MFGKQKCKALKEIRKQIADANDIPYVVSKCEYKGECLGTCPKCEEELKYLEEELEKRKRLGKMVVIAGISLGVCAGAVKCGKEVAEPILDDLFKEIPHESTMGAIKPDISGDIEQPVDG